MPRCSSSIATSQHYTGGTGKLFGKEKRKNGNCIIWIMIFPKRQTWPNPNPKSRPSSALPLTKNKRKSSIIWRSKKNFKDRKIELHHFYLKSPFPLSQHPVFPVYGGNLPSTPFVSFKRVQRLQLSTN